MFTKDLLVDPKTRGATDIAHEVVAAASAKSKDKAAEFLKEYGCPSAARAYGSYKDLVADPDVDIVYVATPHSHHYQHVRLCLEAGKHVLCEKAFTVNAEQAKILVQIAQQKKLFLMEAVWTRYFPICEEIRDMVKQGKIGQVHRVFADLSFSNNVEEQFGTEHRMVNMDLAGGALLDCKADFFFSVAFFSFSLDSLSCKYSLIHGCLVGIYSITWIFQILYNTLPKEKRRKPAVASSMSKYHKTGADEHTSIIMTFPGDINTHGIATTNLRVSHDPDQKGTAGAPIRIQGTLGEIQVMGQAYRPTTYRLIPSDKGADFEYQEVTRDIPGQGMFWEADECARCLRKGVLESEGLDWEESVVIMEVMDEARKQNGIIYPEKIESTEYPLQGF